MTPVWAQRREELWSDCLVSPDVFHEMVDRLGEFVMPSERPPAESWWSFSTSAARLDSSTAWGGDSVSRARPSGCHSLRMG